MGGRRGGRSAVGGVDDEGVGRHRRGWRIVLLMLLVATEERLAEAGAHGGHG